jgi:hypothetical protein
VLDSSLLTLSSSIQIHRGTLKMRFTYGFFSSLIHWSFRVFSLFSLVWWTFFFPLVQQYFPSLPSFLPTSLTSSLPHHSPHPYKFVHSSLLFLYLWVSSWSLSKNLILMVSFFFSIHPSHPSMILGFGSSLPPLPLDLPPPGTPPPSLLASLSPTFDFLSSFPPFEFVFAHAKASRSIQCPAFSYRLSLSIVVRFMCTIIHSFIPIPIPLGQFLGFGMRYIYTILRLTLLKFYEQVQVVHNVD